MPETAPPPTRAADAPGGASDGPADGASNGGVAGRVANLDVGLFEPIPSQTSPDDRRALLAVQDAVARGLGSYVYLEIGSFRGGTLQPHLRDGRCAKVYSIDLRPEVQPDDMHGVALEEHYHHVTAASMLSDLRDAAGAEAAAKTVTFECDVRDVPAGAVDPPPHLVLIDGEHTSRAVRSDFAACRRLAAPNATFLFHDAARVTPALRSILKGLRAEGVPHAPLMLGGVVFAIALEGSPAAADPRLTAMARPIGRYFALSRLQMFYQRTLGSPGAGTLKPLLRPLVRRLRRD